MRIGFRVDGDSRIGMGHLTRSGTIATELLDRGHDVVAISRTPEWAASSLPGAVSVIPFEDQRRKLKTTIAERSLDVVVLDLPTDSIGESADEHLLTLSLQRSLRDVVPLVVVHDSVDVTVCCDVLVNGHVYATVEDFSAEGETPIWCVGGEYVVLEESFRRLSCEEHRHEKPVDRGLISMGGADPENVTPSIMRHLESCDHPIDVVVGPGFTNATDITALARSLACPFRIHESPDDLAALLYEADYAISALGMMAYELIAVGTPFVGIPIAPDQHPKADALRSAGAALVVDSVADIDSARRQIVESADRRRELVRSGRQLIDADGVERVAAAIEQAAR